MFYILNGPKPEGAEYTLPKVRVIGPWIDSELTHQVDRFKNAQNIHPLAVSVAIPQAESHGEYPILVTRYSVTVIYQERVGLPVPIAEDDAFNGGES